MKATAIERFNAKVFVSESGCWLWTGTKDSDGYGRIKISGKIWTAHRLSFRLFNGDLLDGMEVNHSCDVRNCVRPEHLHLGTPKTNARERMERGRGATGDRNGARLYPERLARGIRNGKYTKPESTPRGEKHGMAVLTEQQVIEIKALLKAGVLNQHQIGEIFGVSNYAICDIARGKSWSHIK
jgi:hypothetical protein